ncbi:MAG TPA: hypothetical protein VKB22_02245, partial [Gemmatimonadales bacterium]|nr:hypothetical protein [Gemmatimonadales bacterium]
LQALQLSLIRKDDPLLGDVTLMAAGKIKDLYQKSTGTLKANQPALTLLAWSHCRQSGEGKTTPTFPATSSGLIESLPLKTSLSCGDLHPEDAAPGLDALTDWVKNQK